MSNVTETRSACLGEFLLGQMCDCNTCVPSDHVRSPSCLGIARHIWFPLMGSKGDVLTEARSAEVQLGERGEGGPIGGEERGAQDLRQGPPPPHCGQRAVLSARGNHGGGGG